MRPAVRLLFVLVVLTVSCVRYYPAHTSYLEGIDPSYLGGQYRPDMTGYLDRVLTLTDTLALLELDTSPMYSKNAKVRDCVIRDTLRPIATSVCRDLRVSAGAGGQALYACHERAPATVMYVGTLARVYMSDRGALSCEVLDTVNSLWYTFNVVSVKGR
jgi:hypothetical protein